MVAVRSNNVSGRRSSYDRRIHNWNCPAEKNIPSFPSARGYLLCIAIALGVWLIDLSFLPHGIYSVDGNSMLSLSESLVVHHAITVPPRSAPWAQRPDCFVLVSSAFHSCAAVCLPGLNSQPRRASAIIIIGRPSSPFSFRGPPLRPPQEHSLCLRCASAAHSVESDWLP